MKFRFQVQAKGRVRKGTLEAEDLTTAEAMLERKGFEVLCLQVQLESPQTRWLSYAICFIGLILVIAWPGRNYSLSGEGVSTPKTLHLKVEGKFEVPSLPRGWIVVSFPELPTRLKADFEDVVNGDGTFLIEDRVITRSRAPSYFHVTVQNDLGEVVCAKEKLPYDHKNGLGKLTGLLRFGEH